MFASFWMQRKLTKRTTLWVASESFGVRRSTNKGADFTALQTAIGNRRCVFQHSNRNIYTGTTANLYRSQDDGSNFSVVLALRCERIHYFHGYFYASCLTNGLYRSTSGDADTWTRILNTTVRHAFVDDDGNIYASTNTGVHKSTDDGDTWTSYTTANGLNHDSITQVLVDSHGTIWASSGVGGVHKSTNGGTSWTKYLMATTGNSSDNVTSLAYDPVRDRIYIASSNIYAIRRGIDYTDDGGDTWSHPSLHDNYSYYYGIYYCDGTIYAAGDYESAWSDDGTNWTSILPDGYGYDAFAVVDYT